MGRNVSVYDLGDVNRVLAQTRTGVAAARPLIRERPPQPMPWLTGALEGVVRSLSLFVPGMTQVCRGQFALGAMFASWLLFLMLFGRGLVVTLDDLVPLLQLLGGSAVLVLWGLVAAYVFAAAVHLAAVWTAVEPRTGNPRHPLVPGLASLLVPGWGQLLNGNRLRATMFLGGLWLAAGVWIASSIPARELLDLHVPVVTPFEQAARAPFVVWSLKWTAPLVVWVLAVYDAVAAAVVARRRPMAR